MRQRDWQIKREREKDCRDKEKNETQMNRIQNIQRKT